MKRSMYDFEREGDKASFDSCWNKDKTSPGISIEEMGYVLDTYFQQLRSVDKA